MLLEREGIWRPLAALCSTHALVDAACAGMLFSILVSGNETYHQIIFLFLIYNLLAFGTQIFFGSISDALASPRPFAALGCAITALAALMFPGHPTHAVAAAGIGNSLFHVGGGSISLNLTPGKAFAPGVFVAPGALGLFVGTYLGKADIFDGWHFAVLLAVAALLIMLMQIPALNYSRKDVSRSNIVAAAIILIMLSICLRSLIGLAVAMPWKSNLMLSLILVGGVALGKAIGGVLADSYGWIRVSVAGLAISAPLISAGQTNPAAAILGFFLFNMTMPVTLTAISNLLPGRPGLSFGLNCLALIAGAFPVLMQWKDVLPQSFYAPYAIILSAAIIFVGLKLYLRSGMNILQEA